MRRRFSSGADTTWQRWRALVTLTLVALALVLAGVLAVTFIIEHSLRDSARRSAAEEAGLIVNMGFAGAAASGTPASPIKRVAAAQVVAARRSGAIIGVVAWTSGGRVVFAAPSAFEQQATRRPPPLVRRALQSGKKEIADTSQIAGLAVGPGFAVAVPVASQGSRYVVEVLFSREAEAAAVQDAKHRLYVLAGVGGSVIYLLILPLLGWLAERLPRAADRRRQAALSDLARGLGNHELRLHYQPKLTTKDSRLVGVEALVRWNHPARGVLGPDAFVPLAESSPVLASLTVWVLETATTTCAQWRARGIDLPVAVNIAGTTLLSDRLVDDVRHALESSGLPASMLTLEITETGLMRGGRQAANALATLRADGVRISLDDFGTGYSSLRRLAWLPLDELKIDRSFVVQLARNERVRRIVELVVDLGRRLEMSVVAEGVETESELTRLAALGCPLVQGYLFARPMLEDDLLEWIGRNGDVEPR